MKKVMILVLVVTVAAFAMGCAKASSPVNGLLFSDVKAPISATSSTANSKTGEACASSILGLIATGDASIETAKKTGGITEVGSVDHSSMNILGFYAKFCTIVKGK